MYKKISFIAIISLMIFISPYFSPIVIAGKNTSYESVPKVDHVANVVERLQEKISGVFKFSSIDKAKYCMDITNKRAGEIVFVTTTEDTFYRDYIEESASRYATTLSRCFQYITENKVSESKSAFQSLSKVNSKEIKKAQSNFEYDSGWWLAIQHDINLLKKFSAELN